MIFLFSIILTSQRYCIITRKVGRLQALVTSPSVRSPVAPVAQTQTQGGQGQEGADHARHLAGGQGGPEGHPHH